MAIKSYDEWYKEVSKDTSQRDKDIEILKKSTDAKVGIVKNNFKTAIAEREQQYNDDIRTNEIQRLINERSVAQSMSDLGLTDSGLNRAQQTAVQLSASNNANEISLNRQKAIDSLAKEMNERITTLKTEQIVEENNIRADYESGWRKSAQELHNKEVEAQSTVDAANIKADNELRTKMTSDTNDLIEILHNESLSPKAKSAYIENFYTAYGADAIIPYIQIDEQIVENALRIGEDEARKYAGNDFLKRGLMKNEVVKYANEIGLSTVETSILVEKVMEAFDESRRRVRG